MNLEFYQNSIFPKANNLLSKKFGKYKSELLESCAGKVLEIGFGAGLTLDHYPAGVTKVVGIDPNPGMRKLAREHLLYQNVGAKNLHKTAKITIINACAEALPLPDRTFDSAVSIFTLCSVTDTNAALKEIWRILAPGGQLFFLEHTGQTKPSLTRALQKTIQPLWKKLACGCHLDRDTLSLMQNQGFDVQILRTIGYSGFPNFLSPIYLGIAKKAHHPH